MSLPVPIYHEYIPDACVLKFIVSSIIVLLSVSVFIPMMWVLDRESVSTKTDVPIRSVCFTEVAVIALSLSDERIELGNAVDERGTEVGNVEYNDPVVKIWSISDIDVIDVYSDDVVMSSLDVKGRMPGTEDEIIGNVGVVDNTETILEK